MKNLEVEDVLGALLGHIIIMSICFLLYWFIQSGRSEVLPDIDYFEFLLGGMFIRLLYRTLFL